MVSIIGIPIPIFLGRMGPRTIRVLQQFLRQQRALTIEYNSTSDGSS